MQVLNFAFTLVLIIAAYFYGRWQNDKHWGYVILAALIMMVAVVGKIEIGKEHARGEPASISNLDEGIYAVHGELKVGDDLALWIVPLDTPRDLDHGKLYKLPRSMKYEFGSFVKKDDKGQLIAYQFEGK